MSTWAARTITCACGESIQTRVADGLHITRLPAVRQQILDRTFHRVTCPRCGRVTTIDKKFLYTDFSRFHWIGVCPRTWTPRWSVIEASLTAEFERVICRAAPPAIQALGPKFQVRLVFGYEQLAEKLHIFDAGLDDRIVERVKLRILAKHPDLFVPGAQMLLVPPRPDADRLEFEVFRYGQPGYHAIGCSRELYAAELARSEPSDFDGVAFASLDRILYPSLAAEDASVAGDGWSDIVGTPGSILLAPTLPMLPDDGGV